MKISLQDFNGIFQVTHHRRLDRILWILSIPLFLTLIALSIWIAAPGFSNLPLNPGIELYGNALVTLALLFFPVLGFFIGITKILKKPGIYLSGIRLLNTGAEKGRLTVHDNLNFSGATWGIKHGVVLTEGSWKRTETFKNSDLNFQLKLRADGDQSNRIFLEKFIVTTGCDTCCQIIGNNSLENHCKDIITISNGSCQLLLNDKGIAPDMLLPTLDRITNILSIYHPLQQTSSTLKITPSLTTHGSVLAIGMLGGFNGAQKNCPEDGGHLENIFGTNCMNSLRKLLLEKGWVLIK